MTGGVVRPLDALRTTGMDVKAGQGFVRSVQEDCIVFKPAGLPPKVLAGEALRDIHDVLISGPWIYAVGTDRNAVYRFDQQGKLDKGWRFSAQPDAWHLNCLAEINGKIYFTAFGEFSSGRGYKEGSLEKGFIQCLETGERVASGLSQPHSICTHGGKVYVANSETGEIFVYDGQFVLLQKIQVGGYLRGIAFADGQLLVGVSHSRNMPVQQGGKAKVMAIDLASRQMRIAFEVPAREIYSILSFASAQDFVSGISDLSFSSFAYLAGRVTGDVHSGIAPKTDAYAGTGARVQPVKRSLVPALFMHTQKTAGTSITVAAARHYGPANICSHGDFVGKSPDEMARFAFVSGHFGFEFAKPLLAGRYSFTFLRSPVERVLSFYYYCRTRDPDEFPINKIAQEHDIDSFLQLVQENQHVRDRIWNSQTWRLSSGPGIPGASVDDHPPADMLARAIANLDAFSFIGFTETFNDDAEVIMRGIGLPNALRPGKLNVTPDRPLAKDHSRQTIQRIEAMTELDLALYEAALKRRRSR